VVFVPTLPCGTLGERGQACLSEYANWFEFRDSLYAPGQRAIYVTTHVDFDLPTKRERQLTEIVYSLLVGACTFKAAEKLHSEGEKAFPAPLADSIKHVVNCEVAAALGALLVAESAGRLKLHPSAKSFLEHKIQALKPA
jgi:hypothetical protein